MNVVADWRTLISQEDIFLGNCGKDKYEEIEKAGQQLVEKGCVSPEYIASMLQREREISVYLDRGIAVPHAMPEGRKFVKKAGIVVFQYPDGIPFDENRAYFLIALATGQESHLELLSDLCRILTVNRNFTRNFRNTTDKEEILEAFYYG